MSSTGETPTVLRRMLGRESLHGIRELILASTPESLEQAVVRLEAARDCLATCVSNRELPELVDIGRNELQEGLARLKECAERGEQIVSGRLQVFLGADLLYDRNARPSEAFLPSRMQVEG